MVQRLLRKVPLILAALFAIILAGPAAASAAPFAGEPIGEPVERCLAPIGELFAPADEKVYTCATFKVDGGKVVELPNEKISSEVEKDVTFKTPDGKEVTGDALIVTFSDRKDLDGCKVYAIKGKETGDGVVVTILTGTNKVGIMPATAKDLIIFVRCEKK